MLSLIIDTSLENNCILLAKDRALLHPKAIAAGAQQSRFLIPKIQELLAKAGVSLNQLDLVAAGQGPGTFTGTRVGVVIAKTLAFAKDIPLIAFCSMKPFAPLDYEGNFQILFDAKAGGLYLLQGSSNQKVVAWESKPKFITIKNFLADDVKNNLVISPHVQQLQPMINQQIMPAHFNRQHLIALIAQQYQNRQFVFPLEFNAVYLRDP